MEQRQGKGFDDVASGDGLNSGRRAFKGADRGRLVGLVEDRQPGVVLDHHLADETAGFFHEHHVEILAVADIEAQLRTANADGRHRRFHGHAVDVGLGNLAADEGEQALDHGQGQRAGFGAGVVDHFVQHHAAFGPHGKCGLVGQHDADGPIVGGYQDIALEQRVTHLQVEAAAVGADDGGRTAQFFHLSDGLGRRAVDRRIGHCGGGQGTGQPRCQVA